MKNKDLTREIAWGIIVLFCVGAIIDCYFNLWGFWNWLGINISVFDEFLIRRASFFSTSFIQRVVLLLVVPLIVIFYEGARGQDKPNGLFLAIKNICIGAILFLLAPILFSLSPKEGSLALFLLAGFYLATTIAGVVLLIIGALNLTPYVKDQQLIDNDIEADGFMQNTQLITNPKSINLPMSFVCKKQKYSGWVNIINPFRAIRVMGTPGSGKSFAVIEPCHQQWIWKMTKPQKNHAKGEKPIFIPTMLGYDYKFPTLTRQIYGDYKEASKQFLSLFAPKDLPEYDLLTEYNLYKQWMDDFNARRKERGLSEYPIVPEMVVISFTHPSLTNRCNIFKNLSSPAGVHSMSTVIYTSLMRNAAEKKGEFFVESAKTILTLYAWFEKLYQGGKYCSLPHTIGLLAKSEEEVFPIFELYGIFFPSLATLFSPFKGAYDKGAMEQLQGQLGSVRIGLSPLIDDMIKWVLTEDPKNPQRNVDLDVNNPLSPKILWVGNDGGENEDKKIKDKKSIIYGAAISAIFAAALPVINKKGKYPCMVSIDELPTIFVDGIDELIATARSNEVAVLLGYQDDAQGYRDYGQKVWDALERTVGNVFSGAVKGSSAEKLSKAFGEKKVEKQSRSISADLENSYTQSEQKEKRVPQDRIENLSQGEFVGMITDNFDQPMKNELKAFFCRFNIDPKSKRSADIVSKYSPMEKRRLPYEVKENSRKIDREIDDIILETKPMCDALQIQKNMMGMFTGTKTMKGKERTISSEEILKAFKNKDLEAAYYACHFFQSIYWVVENIHVYEFEYEEGDDLQAKCEVLQVPYSTDEPEQAIIERLNRAAETQKALMLLKYLCPDTESYIKFQKFMEEEFPSAQIANEKDREYTEMYNAMKSAK